MTTSERTRVLQDNEAVAANSYDEQQRLADCENTIEGGLRTFIDVGRALLAIRDGKLYTRRGYDNFEDYCLSRWDIQRTHAYRLMDSAKVIENLRKPLNSKAAVSPMGDILPTSERQTRPLTALPPERQAEAWTQAVAAAPEGTPPTAAIVQKAVDRLLKTGTGRRSRLPAIPGWTDEQLAHDRDLADAFRAIARIYSREDAEAIRNGCIPKMKRGDVLLLAQLPIDDARAIHNLVMGSSWLPQDALDFFNKMPNARTTLGEMVHYCLGSKTRRYVVQMGAFEHTVRWLGAPTTK